MRHSVVTLNIKTLQVHSTKSHDVRYTRPLVSVGKSIKSKQESLKLRWNVVSNDETAIVDGRTCYVVGSLSLSVN